MIIIIIIFLLLHKHIENGRKSLAWICVRVVVWGYYNTCNINIIILSLMKYVIENISDFAPFENHTNAIDAQNQHKQKEKQK